MLWMPSWGGMINGLLTLRGAWKRVAEDPVLKFFVVAITFYGMSTFEGPLLSVKSVNALSHYTDWTIAHVHAGTLGWVGFMVFGMVYWLAPRLYQTPIAKPSWVSLHFWMATIGIILYIIPIYAAGLMQGLMWRTFNADGILEYDFVSTVTRLIPLYWIRTLGGTLYLAALLIGCANLTLTWSRRPKQYEVPVYEAAPLAKAWRPAPAPPSDLVNVLELGRVVDRFAALRWHRGLEGLPLIFTVWVVIAVVVASLFEIVPMFTIRSDIPRIASVEPYTPLECVGRDIYVSEGCVNCHSQMVRPLVAETERYGEYSKPGESVFDHPFLWGSRRIGPDLAREGVRNPSALWHLRHFNNPVDTSPGSIMPKFPHLIEQPIDWSQARQAVATLAKIGVPYNQATVDGAEALARAQAGKVYAQLVQENGSSKGMESVKDAKVLAVIAYLQRLGTDLNKPIDVAPKSAEPPPAAAHIASAPASSTAAKGSLP
jgi:cytochrome c oxidase cbb3-type subunit I/II